MKRTAIIYPASSDGNDYIKIQAKILKELDFFILPFKKCLFFSKATKRKDNVFVSNWLEDRIGYNCKNKAIEVIKIMLIIVFAKIHCKKFIWVKHNQKPHALDVKCLYFKFIEFVLNSIATNIVVHAEYAKKNKITFIPHPLYNQITNFGDNERTIEFLYFGVISRYKGLQEVLEKWPKEKKLKIVGYAKDEVLLSELERIIERRGLNVFIINKFIDRNELDELIKKTKYVILPHKNNSMIVSGSFFHAISYGANIIIEKSLFASELKKRHGFVSYFDELYSLDYCDPRDVFDEAKKHYGDDVVKKHWAKLLE